MKDIMNIKVLLSHQNYLKLYYFHYFITQHRYQTRFD